MSYHYFGRSFGKQTYFIIATQELWEQEVNRLGALLDLHEFIEIDENTLSEQQDLLCGPRMGTTSPANSNLVAAYDAMSGTRGVVTSIEWYTLLAESIKQKAESKNEYDVMTEGIYTLEEIITSHHEDIQFNPDPELLENMTLNDKHYTDFSIELLEACNIAYGLALYDNQIQYFYTLFTGEKYQRTPTLSELCLFAQLNSEHCRHNIFNGRIIVDGEAYEKSMFHLIKDTYKAHPGDVIVAYSDNGAILKWDDKYYIVIKAETHNHPCLIAPFPGGATGSGGCYRDVLCTGRGAMVEVSTSTYCVGDVTRDTPYRTGQQTPETILQEASRGVNYYGNCFAAPLINGWVLAVLEDLKIGDEIFAHAKPVVMAGSAGWTPVGKVDKEKKAGYIHIKLGWPDYAIGIGGAAASSMNSGENIGELDFASVQRANPQMQIKVKKVLETIIHECPDAIRNIHDYGAGGHGTNIFELYEWDENYVGGGEVDIAKIAVEDTTMTYHQILINESQERLGLLIHPDYLEQVEEICAREKCPFDILGQATASGIVRMRDSRTDTEIINVAVDDFLLRDRTEFSDTKPTTILQPLDTNKINDLDLLAVLAHPAVGSKGYIVHHVDRSVRGTIAQQQTVGRRQFPLADYAVFKTDPLNARWVATAQGMRPYHTIISPVIMTQWSLAETVLNLSFVKSKWLEALSLSGNRMRSAKHPSGKTTLYDAVKALSIHTQELGINIPVGKDSLSMKVTTDEGEEVNAPGTLILSGFIQVPDVSKKVTPELKNKTSSLIWFPCISNPSDSDFVGATSPYQGRQGLSAMLRWWLDGSIAGLLTSQLGDTLLEVVMQDVKNLYNLVQELLEKEQLVAGHDISEGGLWSALIEMYIAGDLVNIDIDLSDILQESWKQKAESLKQLLLSEYPGVVLQIEGDVTSVLEYAKTLYGLEGHQLAQIVWSLKFEAWSSQEDFFSLFAGDWSNKPILSYSKQQLIDVWCEYNSYLAKTDAETKFVLPDFVVNEEDAESSSVWRVAITGEAKPKVMVLRDEGTNGEHDMHTAFSLAWFESVDVTMTDLQEKRTSLSDYHGLVLPGGFSYGDWPRSGKSFAEVIRHNPLLSEQFTTFRESGKFALGVCNGNQVLMELGWITDSYDLDIYPMEHNDTGLFESRYLALRVTDSDNRFFTHMQGWLLPIWMAHGEGRYADVVTTHDGLRCAVRYVDNMGQTTEQYPYNPNGSLWWVAGILSADGNVLGMMPHPERTILPHQLAWLPSDADPEVVNWMYMFVNLKDSV